MKISLKTYILTGIFAALTAVFSQLIIPIPIIPISMSLVAVYLSAGILGPVWGTVSQLVYIALGIVGLPVFANFKSGVALIGPTGGYIVGYLFVTLVAGLIIGNKSDVNIVRIFVALVAGLASCYLFGTAWYCIYAEIGFVDALSVCVVPFLAPDAVKVVLATVAIKKLRPIVSKHSLALN